MNEQLHIAMSGAAVSGALPFKISCLVGCYQCMAREVFANGHLNPQPFHSKAMRNVIGYNNQFNLVPHF